MRAARLLCVPLLTIALYAIGCSSSDSPPEKPKPNLRPAAVTVLTRSEDVQAAHGIRVEVEIDADADVAAVGVAYRLFPKADYDAHAEGIVSWVVGGSVQDVPNGGGTFTVELQLPGDVPPGEYYLLPDVDPLDVIRERDESDQYGVVAALIVLADALGQPQLTIERAVLDAPAVELSFATPGTPGPIGLTLLVRAQGSVPVANAELTACVRAPGAACSLLPLGIWEGALGTHPPKLVFPSLAPGEPSTVHLDLALDPALSDELDGVVGQVADACLVSVPGCVANYGVHEACAQECVGPSPDPSYPHYATLLPCMLKCLPFEVEASVDAPGITLYEPPDAVFGTTLATSLQLVAPPPPSGPVRAAELSIRPLADTVFRPVVRDSRWTCDHPSVAFVVEAGHGTQYQSCTEPTVWSVEPVVGQVYYPEERGMGTLVVEGDTAIYTPDPILGYSCYPEGMDFRVLVQASACGATGTVPVTLISGGTGLPGIQPESVDVEVGAEGAVEFTPLVAADCASTASDVTWTIEVASSVVARLVGGDKGTLTAPVDGHVAILYRPPPSITTGPPIPLTLRATVAACGFDETATLTLGMAKELRFERSFARSFDNEHFGAGVDLYGGAVLDGAGVRASAHAIVPVKIFGQSFDLLRATDDVVVDPRLATSTGTFDHRIDVFGLTVSSLSCPGDAICTGEAELWSDSKCTPEGPPPSCVGVPYSQPCARTAECEGELTCIGKHCTKKCDTAADCDQGICTGAFTPGPYKKVFVIVAIPVTVEGKLCANYGFQASLDLLTSEPHTFSAQLGPFLELGGYASAAVGYTGVLAAGVRGELVLVRDDFFGKTSANVSAVTTGDCAFGAGCIQGTLTEEVNNVLQGGSGELFLFADYPAISWCGWVPCAGIAQSKLPLASWGSLYEVANECDFCSDSTPCQDGSSCVGGWCADGFPGVLCQQQSVFVPAQ